MRLELTRRQVCQSAVGGLATPVLIDRGQVVNAKSNDQYEEFSYEKPTTAGYNPDITGPQDNIEVIWRYGSDENTGVSQPAVGRKRVYTSVENRIVSLDKESGEPQWEHKSEGDLTAPAIRGETVFVGSSAGLVIAVDAETGDEQWKQSTPSTIDSPPTVSDETLYIGDREGFYAFDRKDGRGEWRIPEWAGSKATLGSESIWVASGPTITAIVPEEYYRPDRVGNSNGERSDEDTTEPTGWRQNALPVTNINDKQVLRFTSTYSISHSSPAIEDGTVYVPGLGIQSIDIQRGTEEWYFDDEVAIPSSPVVADGTVYAGSGTEIEDMPEDFRSNAGTLYAIDADSGTVSWRFETEGSINTSPAVTQTTLYVTSTDSYVYALERSSGKLKWKFRVRETTGLPMGVGEGIGAPVVTDNRVYCGTTEDGLVVLGESRNEGEPSDTEKETSGDEPNGAGEASNTTGTNRESAEGTPASDDGSGAGFGAPGALAALGGAGYLLGRSADESRE